MVQPRELENLKEKALQEGTADAVKELIAALEPDADSSSTKGGTSDAELSFDKKVQLGRMKYL